MSGHSRSSRRRGLALGTTRRAFLRQASGAALAVAAGVAGSTLARPRIGVAASPVSLNYWTGYPENEPFLKKAGEEYAKTHPGFKLEVLSSQLREMEQKVASAIPTDTGPDLFDISRAITISLADAGLLPPNPPQVMALLRSKAYDPVAVTFNSWKGQVYGLPLLDGGREALYYNTKMFTEAGLDPKKPPATFDELMAAARKLAKKDANGNLVRAGLSLRLSGQGSGVAAKFEFVLYPMGGNIVVQTKSGKWRNNYDNDAGRSALKFYIDAVHKYQVDDPKLPHDAAAFVSEQAAMLMREAWVIGELKSKGPKVQYNTVATPRAKRWGGTTWPYNIYVTRTTKNPDVAWDFAQFLVSPPMGILLIQTSGWTPMRQDIDWSPVLRDTPQYKPFVMWDKGREFFTEPPITVWDELETKLADRLVTAYLDKSLVDNPAGIAKTIKAMAEETDGYLKKAGIYGTD